MTSLTYQGGRNCINSLGIPVDSLTLASAVDQIVAMARIGDGRARLVSTLNVDFMVNSLGTAFRRPRHPELLDVLRSSDLVTADGFPIVWLSRILGRPLPGRVCGSDLTPALAERCARENLSIFLLGGGEGSAAAAGRVLEERYPGLRIAGTAAPFIHTAGEGLASIMEDDKRLLNEIHRSGADILLVGLGNPKQELWFNRNRSALKVSVSIGVGGTFEFITGKVRRAPQLLQRLNLEWLYRISQDPARLWKRYGKGLIKMGLLAAPVIASRAWEGLSQVGADEDGNTLNWRQLWSSRDQSISLLALPSHPGPRFLAAVNQSIHECATPGALHILDFSAVRRIPLRSQQELFNLASLLQSHRGQLQLMGICKRVRKQLAGARLLDLLDGDSDGALGCVTQRPEGNGQFSCQSYALASTTLVTLAGRVDRESLAAMGFVECLMHSARDRTCIIDFRNVDLLESSGIAELMPLLTRNKDDMGSICLSGVSHGTAQMLRMAEIAVTARFLDDKALLAHISGAGDHDKQGIYIVLLNWNGWRDTIACLESLLGDMASGARVVVCDNASTDGSLDHIECWAEGKLAATRCANPRLARLQRRDLPAPLAQRVGRHDAERGYVNPEARLILVDNGANMGFAAGNNVGLRFAISQTDMTHVWLLNNDTLVEPDCLEAMKSRLAAHGRPAVCGSIIHFYDDPEVIQCIGGNRFDARRGRALESEGRFVHESALAGREPGARQLDYLSGCSMLLPRSFLETVGLMSEVYFLYYEEIDWFTRAAGRFDLVVAEGARLYHREGGSIGSRSWRRGPSLTADRHMFRSRIRFVRHYYPQWLWRCALHNWLDVIKRLARGQWHNALVICSEILRGPSASHLNP